MRQFLGFLGILALSVLFIWGLEQGINRQEVVECRQWEQQAKEYPGFYLTQWQDDQCQTHGISINAPVRGAK